MRAHDYAGPLLPHVGGQITTAFSNHFGSDAESTLTFTSITPEILRVDYSSTRGLLVKRDIRLSDRASARVYVLGYAPKMPHLIANTTSLGISGDVLEELRSRGQAAVSLANDADLNRIDGQLNLVE